jgi:hypothetical protein
MNAEQTTMRHILYVCSPPKQTCRTVAKRQILSTAPDQLSRSRATADSLSAANTMTKITISSSETSRY